MDPLGNVFRRRIHGQDGIEVLMVELFYHILDMIDVYKRQDLRGEKDNLLLMPVPLHVMYFMWGMILYKLGKEEAAMKKFKWACRLNPFHTLPYAAMNRYYEKHGDRKAWLDNIRREGKTIYADGVTEAFAELGRYLAFEGRIPEARACYEYVLDWNAETELPDAFTKELADLLDSTAEVADFDDCLLYTSLDPLQRMRR